VLADEINRASPRTQSALLEAMNEAQVTIEGRSHPLPAPFCVIATQNPVDYQGTYPLPEAQLDRFLMCIALGYPARAQELDILYAHQSRAPLDTLEPASSRAELERMQGEVRQVEVRPAVGEYLLALVARTRAHAEVALGVSPRGALAWFRAAQARAYLDQRDYVSPDDLQALAAPVLAHRLLLTPEARYGGKSAPALLAELLGEIDVPL
jgi:MoxR-like ATPase